MLEEIKMNWFQRHLNWTWLLSVVVGGFIIGFAAGIITAIYDPYGLHMVDDAVTTIISLLNLLVAFLVGGCVLRQKNRTLWWLFIILVPLVGWIIFLCIENRSNQPALQV
jgi:hypothetical protein